jgi:hypothetical protein
MKEKQVSLISQRQFTLQKLFKVPVPEKTLTIFTAMF